MKKFFFRANKDSGDPFLKALLSAGYERVGFSPLESASIKDTHPLEQADFIVLDHDYAYKATPEWQQFFTPESLRKKPLLIYPHVPYSWFLWDGILSPKPVRCNFVVSNGAKVAMQMYGYPYPVEVVGFAGVKVKPFQPTTGTKLLFAPAHPVHDGKYPQPVGLRNVKRAVNNLLQHWNYFESVTVRYSNTIEACGLDRLKDTNAIFEHVDVYRTPNIRQNALESIARADLVISESSFAYLSAAVGKPTLFYGHSDCIPHSREGWVKNYEKYRSIFQFPCSLETMTIGDILTLRTHEPPEIARWKHLNIGEDFDAEKFLKLVKEYLRD